jgi:hypothetical protein
VFFLLSKGQEWHHDIQHNNTQHKRLHVTVSISDTQQKQRQA